MKKILNIFMSFFVVFFFLQAVACVWAVDGTQKWVFKTDNKVEFSPAMGPDGTVYVGSGLYLYAINPDGTQKWAYKPENSYGTPVGIGSSPAIGPDGTIYIGSGAGLFAINPAGTQKWNYGEVNGEVASCPAMGPDGTIYLGYTSNLGLIAINSDGTSKWWFNFGSTLNSSPAIGPDGTIYVHAGNLYAVDPNGTQKWVYETDGQDSSPAIGSDGTIYIVGFSKVYAMNPDGTQKWAFKTEGLGGDSSAAVGHDGTIYAAVGEYLYAINPADGSQKWAFKTGGGSTSSPAVGSDGTIYVGFGDNNVYAVNPDGTQKWSFETGDCVNSSPAIGSDGTIYVGSDDNNMYAINGSSGGLAHMGWPMFQRDVRHTGFGSSSPVPDIKANGYDGSITVSTTTPVSITVSLNPCSFVGQNADWWVVEFTPSSTWDYFDLVTSTMVNGLLPTYQGPLFNFDSTKLFSFSDLTEGPHTFYFGVDLNMNGSLDLNSTNYDKVRINVTGP